MAKERLFSKRKEDPSLAKIIVIILIGGATVLGIVRFSSWFNQDYIASGVEANADEDLERVRQLLDEGNLVEAGQVLRPILARVTGDSVTPRALMLQADLERRADNIEGSLENLKRIVEEFPSSPDQPVAAVAYARLLEEEERFDEALSVYQSVLDSAPPELRAAAQSGLARQMEREGKSYEALALYRSASNDAPWGTPDWLEAAEAVGRLNVVRIFSPIKTDESKIYRTAKGDSLTSIGMRLNTTQGLLMRANGMTDPNRLRVNQNLKYTPKDFRIIIELSTCRLYLMDGDGLFKIYSVGLGKPGQSTTTGKYKIGNKEKDPTWFKPGAGPIPSGDPRNELGTRWMPMVPETEGLPADLGIHGTITPESIGKYTSMGCPRLYKEEVEELYDLVVRSTPVTVVEVYHSDRAV